MTEAYRFIESSPRSLNMNFPLRELRDRRYTRGIIHRTFGRELRRKAYLDTFDYDTPAVPGDGTDHISKLPDVVFSECSVICILWIMCIHFLRFANVGCTYWYNTIVCGGTFE
ncbi:hypothetical protein AB6A40_010224 [Gnathostoma spinigerum]|uniref:Uncharacterized protein n=1 Tax=Gnathostoma spinigerum TaxID=75299 RepID=A0ABD6EVJ5_9BILA